MFPLYLDSGWVVNKYGLTVIAYNAKDNKAEVTDYDAAVDK